MEIKKNDRGERGGEKKQGTGITTPVLGLSVSTCTSSVIQMDPWFLYGHSSIRILKLKYQTESKEPTPSL